MAKSFEPMTCAMSCEVESDETKGAASRKDKFNPLKKRRTPPVPSTRGESGEFRAGLLSSLYFQWMLPLLSVGYQRPLELNDVWDVNPERSICRLTSSFKGCLKERKAVPGRLDPIIMALYDAFRTDFLLGGLGQLVAGCLQVLAPFVLKYLIQYVQEAYNARINDVESPAIARGLGLVIGIAVMQLFQSLGANQYYYRSMIVGGQARSTIIACITQKAMKLSGRARTGREGSIDQGWSNAKIGNLMSTDTSRIDSAASQIHRCWVGPIQIVLALALLCINLGYSALVGFGLFCGVTPLLALAIGALIVRRDIINRLTDERIHLTQETFSAIRIVKFFTWESKLISRLDDIRSLETSRIAYLMTIRNAVLAAAVVLPAVASMLTFITYSLSGHHLTAAPIFSSLALFNALGIPLEVMPTAIGRAIDALAAVKRISAFLDAEEATDHAAIDLNQEDAIMVDCASFVWEHSASRLDSEGQALQNYIPSSKTDGMLQNTWDNVRQGNPTQPAFSIRDLSFCIGRQELVVVIGATGSGKSSLLSALAGDMRRTKGSVSFGGSRALCSQSPWIQNTSLRDNVTFGKAFDQGRYKEVVQACALQPDIDILPNGDLTEIGEKGVTISGGQRQRLSLARAIYFEADIVLMDDPLSAVDAHVGRHIVDHAVCGLLRDKCCILATHQLHVLPRADRIIWMKDGSIYKIATYEELIVGNVEFQELMIDTDALLHGSQQSTDAVGDIPKEEITPVEATTGGQEPTRILMQVEERATGSVSWAVYAAFIRASGSIWNLAVVTTVLSIAQGASVLTTVWLSWWVSRKFSNLQVPQYIGVYAALGVFQAILMFVYATTLTALCTRAGKTMLNNAISHTIRAPISFFDTTPIGRITNRFSKDVDTIDNSLTDDLRFLLYIVATILSAFCLTIAYYWYFAIALLPLVLAFAVTASYYRKTAREIKRHEAILRSDVFARFAETISGILTIRAYNVQSRFLAAMSASLDSMDGAYFLTFAGQRWLSTRLDMVGVIIVFVAGILIVTSRFDVDPSVGGVVLSYMLSTVQLMQYTVHTLADVENEVNSVERLYQYGRDLEQEEDPTTAKHEIRSTWPEKGDIRFEEVQMRYREGLPLALKGLTVHIEGGQSVGIVGRTGAGKSSIVAMMFRLVEPTQGKIFIDGVDIATLTLHDLRSRLSIIPQDPTLFRGTIRSNLDPFDEYDDGRLWQALRKANFIAEKDSLKPAETQDPCRVHLDSPVEDEGLNFSLGQRQLLALARVLLEDSQVIMFDEATSSVDNETDKKIQLVVRQAFQGKTLLCIAHRLKTIIGYDQILVMDSGSVAEYDSPLRLFDRGGVFHSMCNRSGITREQIVLQSEASDGS